MTAQSLRTLIAALTRNETPSKALFEDAFRDVGPEGVQRGLPHLAMLAAASSFDAAWELFQAVMPERTYSIYPTVAYTHTDDTQNASTGQVFGDDGRAIDDPGRAFLIAIADGLAQDLENAPSAPDEPSTDKPRERVSEDASGALRIDALADQAMLEDALPSILQQIMLHNTRRRADGTSYMLYGAAMQDICALLDAMKPVPQSDNWEPVERVDRSEPWDYTDLLHDHDDRCDEIERLRDSLRMANANHERFERLFYMLRDQSEAARWITYTDEAPEVGTSFVYIHAGGYPPGLATMSEAGPIDCESLKNFGEFGDDWWKGVMWTPAPKGYEFSLDGYTGDEHLSQFPPGY